MPKEVCLLFVWTLDVWTVVHRVVDNPTQTVCCLKTILNYRKYRTLLILIWLVHSKSVYIYVCS